MEIRTEVYVVISKEQWPQSSPSYEPKGFFRSVVRGVIVGMRTVEMLNDTLLTEELMANPTSPTFETKEYLVRYTNQWEAEWFSPHQVYYTANAAFEVAQTGLFNGVGEG